jgi:hypothetical protein
MKTFNLIVALFGFTACFAQYSDNLPQDVRKRNENVSFEPGLRVPVGALADVMGASPELGIWVRGKINTNNYLDIGGSAFALEGTEEFMYTDRGATYGVTLKGVGGTAGFRLAKVYELNTGKLKTGLEWLSTFGYAFLMYEDKYTVAGNYGSSIEKTDLKAFHTFTLGQGIRFTVDNVGLQVNYNYSPYGQFSSNISSSFGAHSLSAGIIYKL